MVTFTEEILNGKLHFLVQWEWSKEINHFNYGFEFFVKIVYAYHNWSSASFQNKNTPPYRYSSRIWSTSGRRTLESNFTPPRETLRVFECEDGNKQEGGSSKDITEIWPKRCF